MSEFESYMSLYGTPAMDRSLWEDLTYRATANDIAVAVRGSFVEQAPMETDEATGKRRERRAVVHMSTADVVPEQYGLVGRVSTGEEWSIRDWPVVRLGVAELMCSFASQVAMRRPGTRR